MHLYCISRGIKQDVDRFIKELECQYLPFKYRGFDFIQMSVRPVQLWEMVFPKELKDLMINTIIRGNPPEHETMFKYPLAVLRKLLNAKKVEDTTHKKRLAVYHENVQVLPIGIREDVMHEEGHEML